MTAQTELGSMPEPQTEAAEPDPGGVDALAAPDASPEGDGAPPLGRDLPLGAGPGLPQVEGAPDLPDGLPQDLPEELRQPEDTSTLATTSRADPGSDAQAGPSAHDEPPA